MAPNQERCCRGCKLGPAASEDGKTLYPPKCAYNGDHPCHTQNHSTMNESTPEKLMRKERERLEENTEQLRRLKEEVAHSTMEGWEEEFDERWYAGSDYNSDHEKWYVQAIASDDPAQEIKSFIASLLAKATESAERRVREAVLGYENWTEWERKTLIRLLEAARKDTDVTKDV